MAFGMKAHSLFFFPPFFSIFSSFSRASRDGDVTPCSHFETVDKASPNLLARSSCVNPNFKRIALMLTASFFIVKLLSYI